MPREIITVQVGQCGNQIGRAFWSQALQEHAGAASFAPREGRTAPAAARFDEAMGTFFRNVDPRSSTGADVPRDGTGSAPIGSLRARAVLVDMEDSVVKETSTGPLGELFESQLCVTDSYGAGNNWAHGFGVYGPQHSDALREAVRNAAERCDSLQSFFLMHSMGGGTGSGLGTYVLSQLEDDYPGVFRFVTAVFPSADDDVVTSPYNTVLALRQLTDHADCVLPVDNASLARAVQAGEGNAQPNENSSEGGKPKEGFDQMNGVVASVLSDLTSSMRFAGSLNVDLGEITTNLVPFPRLHYLLPSLSPLPSSKRALGKGDGFPRHRALRQMFGEAFSPRNQLMAVDPRSSRFLAAGLFARGDVVVSEMNDGVAKLQSQLDMIHWNREGFKTGLCSVPPLGRHQPRSLLCLANSCCMVDVLSDFQDRFEKLYKRRAMVHHYTQYIAGDVFEEAMESLVELSDGYMRLAGTSAGQRPLNRRFRPLI
jgi:tubulin epsilon